MGPPLLIIFKNPSKHCYMTAASNTNRQFYDLVQLIKSSNVPLETVLSYINHPEFIELIDLIHDSPMNNDYKVAMAAIFSGYTISVKELQIQQFIDYCSACIHLLFVYKIKLKSQISLDAENKARNKHRNADLQIIRTKVDELRSHVSSLRNIFISSKKKQRAGEQLFILSILNATLIDQPLSMISTYTNEIIEYKFEWNIQSTTCQFSTKVYQDEIYSLESLSFLISHININNISLLNRILDVIGPYFAKFIDKSQLITSHFQTSSLQKKSLRRDYSRKRKKSTTTVSSYTMTRSNSEISLSLLNYNGSSKFFNAYVAIILLFLKQFKQSIISSSSIINRKLFRFLLYFVSVISADVLDASAEFNIDANDFSVITELLSHAQDPLILRKFFTNESPMITMAFITNISNLHSFIKQRNLLFIGDSNMDSILESIGQLSLDHFYQILQFQFPQPIDQLQSILYVPMVPYIQSIHEYYPNTMFNAIMMLLLTNEIYYFKMHLLQLEHYKMQYQDHKYVASLLQIILTDSTTPTAIGPILGLLDLCFSSNLFNPHKLIPILHINVSPILYCLLMQFIKKSFFNSIHKNKQFVSFLMTANSYPNTTVDWTILTNIVHKYAPEMENDLKSITKDNATTVHYISAISQVFVHLNKKDIPETVPTLLSLLLAFPGVDICNLIFHLFEKHRIVIRIVLEHKDCSKIISILFTHRNYVVIKLKIQNIQFIPLELGNLQQQLLPNFMSILKLEYTSLAIQQPQNDQFSKLANMVVFPTDNKLVPHHVGLLLLDYNKHNADIGIVSRVARSDPMFLVKTAFLDSKVQVHTVLGDLILKDPNNMGQLASICINYTLGLLRKMKQPSLAILLEMNQLLTNCFLINAIDYKDLIKHKANGFITPDATNDLHDDILITGLHATQLTNLYHIKHYMHIVPSLPHSEYKIPYYSSLLLYLLHNLNSQSIPIICKIQSNELGHVRDIDALLLFINQKWCTNQQYLTDIVQYFIKCHPTYALPYLHYTLYHLYQIHGDVFIMACIKGTIAVLESVEKSKIINFYSALFYASKEHQSVAIADNMRYLLSWLYAYYGVQVEPLDVVKETITKELMLKLIINVATQGFNGKLMQLYLILIDNNNEEVEEQEEIQTQQDNNGYIQMMHICHLIKYNQTTFEMLLNSKLVYLPLQNDVLQVFKLYIKHSIQADLEIKLGDFLVNLNKYFNVYFTQEFVNKLYIVICQVCKYDMSSHMAHFIYKLTKLELIKGDLSLSQLCGQHPILLYNPYLDYIPPYIDYTFDSMIDVLVPLAMSHGNNSNNQILYLLRGYMAQIEHHTQLSYKQARINMSVGEYERYYLLILMICCGFLLKKKGNCAYITILINELIENNNNTDILELSRSYLIACGSIYNNKMNINATNNHKRNKVVEYANDINKRYLVVRAKRGITLYRNKSTIYQLFRDMTKFVKSEFKQNHLLGIPNYMRDLANNKEEDNYI